MDVKYSVEALEQLFELPAVTPEHEQEVTCHIDLADGAGKCPNPGHYLIRCLCACGGQHQHPVCMQHVRAIAEEKVRCGELTKKGIRSYVKLVEVTVKL